MLNNAIGLIASSKHIIYRELFMPFHGLCISLSHAYLYAVLHENKFS